MDAASGLKLLYNALVNQIDFVPILLISERRLPYRGICNVDHHDFMKPKAYMTEVLKKTGKI